MRRLLFVSALALAVAPLLASGADYALSGQNTTIKFVGTKPDGEHVGGFKSVKGKASVDSTDLTTLKIALDIDMTSLYADNPNLANHLKSPDFFGVKSNPTSKFVTTKVEKAGKDYRITGDLTMVGKTNSVTFPAKIAVGGDGLTLTSSFTIEKSKWGMNYGKNKIGNEVQLTVSVKAK